MSDKRHTLKRPNGLVIMTGPDGAFEADTSQCVHCGAHWQHRAGSKTVRGYCGRCRGPICSAKCIDCVPIEQQLDNMEAGREVGFVPATASVLWTP